ncbi:MAG: hypothetical protein CBD18_08520 [Opitutales bacterium TMED158]|nr:MAG: hypothetical protein CBD18_08520 [Opitutales bacterium TMED158]
MKIVEKRSFDARPEDLWQVVRDPGNLPAWSQKCVECESIRGGGLGSRFNAVFEVRDKRQAARGEVIAHDEGREIVLRFEYEESNGMGSVDESFRIAKRKSGQIELVHTVDFQRSTLPYWVKLLIGFLGRFGRRMGPDQLAEIETCFRETDRRGALQRLPCMRENSRWRQ